MFAKIKKAKQKATKKAHHLADKLFGSSSEGVAEQSPSVSITDSGTRIAVATPVPASDSNLFLAPPASSSGARRTSVSQPTAVPLASSSIDALLLSESKPDDLRVEKDPSLFHGSESASIASPGPERSTISTAWSGLKTLIGLLNEGANKFGPLKSAFGEILGCIEIFERAAKGREDYSTLRGELDSLFRELSGYLKGPTPPAMTSSLENLAKGIKREIGVVQGKERRGKIERVAQAMEDTNEIFECYRRIQGLLERVTFNANMNIWMIVDEQTTDRRLDKLSPSPAAQYGSAESTDLRRNACIPNTRIDLLSQLKAWADDSNSKKIYWLNGMAGTGKTTIAYTLCDYLERSLTLAASFFCSRQLPVCRNVSLIVPTIAYQLGDFSLPFRHALSSALEQTPNAPTLTVSKQFQKLIVEPLLKVQHTIPPDLMVVIDALDECDSKDGVDQILETLLLHAPGLPIKFFVTSRPEARILNQMQAEQSRGVPEKLDLHNLDRSVVRGDIKTYLKTKLVSPKLTLTDTNLEKLVDQCGVLFIYAATVVRYIMFDNFSRSAKRLSQVLAASSSSRRDASVEIDTLYEDILKAALNDKGLNPSDRKEMNDVLHTVICAQEPMTVGVIAGLLRLDVDSVRAALGPLSSVLHLSSEANGVVTTFHESFPDFMFDEDRSGSFYCDSQSHNTLLAQHCFGLIAMRNPPFNICNLQSSYVFDKDVPDLDRKVETTISDEMFYACRYWGPHLMLVEISPELLAALRDFLSVRLLLWMEVMNLKQCISAGVGILHQVQARLQGASRSDEVQELALDAWRFALEFSTSPMSRSTPHIYVSALPFWPNQRPISKCYYSKMQGMTSVTGTAMGRRQSAPLAVCIASSAVQSVAYSFDGTRIVSGSSDGTIQIWDANTGQPVGEPLEGHTGAVYSVAYLPDSTHIVSGSYDKTIRIWDARTGQMVGEPLEGHTSAVYSVAYSPDSTRIVSGSFDTTIRIWDAHSGQMVGDPLKGHTDYVRSVAYSHDGTRIVSGSDDKTIRIWDAHSGQMVGEPLRGHTNYVRSVAYLHDGTRIVSGSDDNTIRTWDARTGQMVGELLVGHTSLVYSVAYSPDSTHIVSGSYDKTIRIWDAHTRRMVGEPLEGHTGAVYSVAYSPDSTRIVSGSDDNTIRIWDVHTGQMVDEPLKGHTSEVYSAAYSPDSTHIVSGSGDNTIRIWDAHTGQMVGEPLKGHTNAVYSVAYSPDSTRIVSGSDDKTIRIWDAHTGQMVGEPLEGHTNTVYSVAYSPGSTRIVSGSSDSTIRIWDAHTRQMVGEPLWGHTDWVRSVGYSHDGARIVSGSDDNTIRIWDAHTRQMVGEPLEGHTGFVLSVAYSPDSTRIISGSNDKTIRIWDVHTGQMVDEPLKGHTSTVYSVAYSPDSTHIVSGSNDRTIRIWDAHTGQMVGEPLEGHTSTVCSVVYSPDSTHIVSGSGDNTIRISDAHTGQMVNRTRNNSSTLMQFVWQTPHQGQLVSDVPISNPALSSYPTANPYTHWTLNEDGWVLEGRSKLLMWVPPDMRSSLLHPRTLAIISKSGSLALDFSNAHLGENWYMCYCSESALPV